MEGFGLPVLSPRLQAACYKHGALRRTSVFVILANVISQYFIDQTTLLG